MDYIKVGNLIYNLRKEKNMTQKQLADKMNLSDRTISKWERGIGCPDVSLLHNLSNILEVNIEHILSGDLDINSYNGGNMKKIKFFTCQNCNNILFGTGDAQISCCGRRLLPLDVKAENANHKMLIETIENDYYITINHEMSKSHYISFIAYVDCDRITIVKLYPEQSATARFPKMSSKHFYAYCSEYGLWKKSLY